MKNIDSTARQMIFSRDEGVEYVVTDYLNEQQVDRWYIDTAVAACKLFKMMMKVYEMEGSCFPTQEEFKVGEVGEIRVTKVKSALLINFRRTGWPWLSGVRKTVKTDKQGVANIKRQSFTLAMTVQKFDIPMWVELKTIS